MIADKPFSYDRVSVVCDTCLQPMTKRDQISLADGRWVWLECCGGHGLYEAPHFVRGHADRQVLLVTALQRMPDEQIATTLASVSSRIDDLQRVFITLEQYVQETQRCPQTQISTPTTTLDK